MPVGPPPPLSLEVAREICKPTPRLERAAEDSLLGQRLLFERARNGEGAPVQLEVYLGEEVGTRRVVVELPRECFDLDRRGNPKGLSGPIVQVRERYDGRRSGWAEAKPNAEGDFLSPDEGLFVKDTRGAAGSASTAWGTQQGALGQTTAFYLAHRFAAATLEWFGRIVKYERSPLPIFPHGNIVNNAQYTPRLRAAVSLGVIVVDKRVKEQQGQLLEFAKSPRVIRHELGHGLLSALQPYQWDVWWGAIFHEGFGDFLDVCEQLRDPERVAEVLAEWGGDPWRSSSLSRVIAETRFVDPAKNADRDLFNELTADTTLYANPTTKTDAHQPSLVASGALYRLLLHKFDRYRSSGLPPNEALARAAREMGRLTGFGAELLPPNYLKRGDGGRALLLAGRLVSPEDRTFFEAELVRRKLVTAEDLSTVGQPKLAAAFQEARGGRSGPLTKKEAQRFVNAHLPSLGVADPFRLLVTRMEATAEGGQRIFAQLTAKRGIQPSLWDNHAVLVTDHRGRLIAHHAALPGGALAPSALRTATVLDAVVQEMARSQGTLTTGLGRAIVLVASPTGELLWATEDLDGGLEMGAAR